jgi:hypothetical protein
MKNEVLVSLLVFGLVACGGESNKNNESDFGDFSSGIKGVEEQPSLTNEDVSEGDSLGLNTIHHGNIEHESNLQFDFIAEQHVRIAVVLSSEDENLNLSVTGNGDSGTYVNHINDLKLYSTLAGSSELIVFDAMAGEGFFIKINSYSGIYDSNSLNSDFQLKIVEANRASVGLSVNEYLVGITSIGNTYCGPYDEFDPGSDYSETGLFIINWQAGYIANSDGSNRNSFDSITDNTFTYSSSYSQASRNLNSNTESISIFKTDFDSGVVTNLVSGTYTSEVPTSTLTCQFTSEGSGNILL